MDHDPFGPVKTAFQKLPSFKQLASWVKAPAGGEQTVYNLAGSARSFLIALIREQVPGRPILVITESAERAEEFKEDLENILGEEQVDFFPSGAVSHYQARSLTVEERSYRLATLKNLLLGHPQVIVASIRSLMDRITPRAVLSRHLVTVRKKGELDFQKFAEELARAGYERLPLVEQYGEFSVRGGIVDIYPLDCEHPVRLEFWGDTVESIRYFDLSSQRSIAEAEEVHITPFREIIVDPERVEAVASCLEEEPARQLGEQYIEYRGLEQYIPLFYDDPETLADYLPPGILVVLDDRKRLAWEGEFVYKEAETDHQLRLNKGTFPGAEPARLYRPVTEVLKAVEAYARINLSVVRPDTGDALNFNALSPDPVTGELKFFRRQLENWRQENFSVLVYSDSPGHVSRLADLLEKDRLPVSILVGSLNHGFVLRDAGLVVYTDRELFHRIHRRYRPRRFSGGVPIESYRTLDYGDYVVHADYGIGIYRGIRQVKTGVFEKECLILEYTGQDRIYVPIEQLDRVHKYVGGEGAPPTVNSLKGTAWEKTKERIQKGIEDMTRELLDLYAARQTREGTAYPPDTDWQKELEASFLYEETRDQLQATEEVKQDLELKAPMDRLVCGDVGFGKTEIAVRAAFKVVTEGKQVAVLVPTTILAQQHYTTFRQRLERFPVVVEMLSRFKTKKEQTDIATRLGAGKVEIVIGTHRLLSKDIRFADLGLLVVDEEQQFGVRHKEKIKQLKEQVDVLTLSATPIPRTLYMSLLGIRHMSLVNTPPKGRLAITTQVLEFDQQVIAQAVMQEVRRGGQVYFVHNRVQTMGGMYNFLQRLLPGLRIAVGHGQMKESALERVMLDFLDRKYDVLLCTMIIEAGLDIPNVNTIIVNRADTFGLAQLYQLRGRVGRSTQKAYAYLLTPPWSRLDKTAKKRLATIQEFSDLGAGYKIANRDLEIRGAGNLLGAQQHGFVTAVGFDLYCQLLEETAARLKGQTVEKKVDTQVKIPVSAYLPARYIPDPHQKVNLYYRLADVSSPEQLAGLAEEIKDRFGPPPMQTQLLLKALHIKVLAQALKMETVELKGPQELLLTFDRSYQLDKQTINRMVKNACQAFEFISGAACSIKTTIEGKNHLEKMEHIIKFLTSLG